MKYSENYFKDPVNTSVDTFIWVNPDFRKNVEIDGNMQVFPVPGASGVAISIQLMQLIFPDFDPDYHIDGIGNLEYQYRNIFLYVSTNFLTIPIVAIYDANNFTEPLRPFTIIDNYNYNRLFEMFQTDNSYQLISVMFQRGGNFNEVKSLAKRLLEKDYLMYCSVGSVRDILRLGDLFGVAAEGFLYASLGIAVFSFLLILNYMSSSVRFRAKEIAVYRVIGARRLDVAKIFLTEGVYMAIISSVFACILGSVITYLFNLSFKGMLQIFNLSFSILSFNIFIIALVFIMVTALIVAASMLPILAVTRRKAIDALKVIG